MELKIKKNKWGHRFITEPKERIDFRKKCKFRDKLGCCEKGCKAFTYSNPRTKIVDTVLIGCTPIVQDCARVNRWDRRHGLIQPYTIVENKDYLD